MFETQTRPHKSPTGERPCHVCDSLDRIVLFHQEFSGLSSGSFLHGYDVCICRQCGFGFADDLPPGESFDKYYAEMSKWEFLDTSGIESGEDTRRFRNTASLLQEFNINRQAPVLDIGCATGGMLAILKQQGFSRLLGLDPSPQCAQLARKIYDIEVFTGPVQALKQLPSDFGLVLLSGVLEHFYDPNAALKDVRDRLGENGLFYICVPDATRFGEYFDAPYQHFSIEHILFFSPVSLTNLLRRNGFEPVKVAQNAYSYTRRSCHPVVEAVFRKSASGLLTRDDATEPALRQYIHVSAALEETIERQIATLADGQEPILVWGVGTYTQRIMLSTQLREANIIAFVDSNPHYHGKQLEGHPIISPREVSSHSEPILIASIIFRDEIVEQIREQLKCDNRLILLGAS